MKRKHFSLFVIFSLVLSLSGIDHAVYAKSNPSLTAMKLAKEMECGWNLGNTLDAFDNWSKKNYPFNEGVKSETDWETIKTTKEIIETGIKQGGYKTIRIPVTWSNHLIDTKYTIDPAWMARVKQIVDWAYEAGYYVILNEHHSVHDNMSSPLKKYEGYIVAPESAGESKAFLKAIWTQICQTFNNDYDEHLIFETMNEPRDTRTVHAAHCWDMQPDTCDICKADIKLLNEYNQLILDTIRASGGNNAKRFVMIPAIATSITEPLKADFKMPTDSATDKLMLTVHLYPLDSGGTGHGSHHFDTGTKNDIAKKTKALYDKFVSKGIPVVIGEFGAARVGYDSDGNKIADFVITAQDRLDCFTYFAQQAGKFSMPFINWDCGGDNGMATINRKTCSIYEPEYLAAVIKAWKDANASANASSQSGESLIDPEEVPLSMTIWDTSTNSSFANNILYFGKEWEGANIWLGEKDISNYKTVEITYSACTGEIRCYLTYADGTETRLNPEVFESGAGTLSISLDSTKRLQAIFFQGARASVTVTLEKILLKP